MCDTKVWCLRRPASPSLTQRQSSNPADGELLGACGAAEPSHGTPTACCPPVRTPGEGNTCVTFTGSPRRQRARRLHVTCGSIRAVWAQGRADAPAGPQASHSSPCGAPPPSASRPTRRAPAAPPLTPGRPPRPPTSSPSPAGGAALQQHLGWGQGQASLRRMKDVTRQRLQRAQDKAGGRSWRLCAQSTLRRK